MRRRDGSDELCLLIAQDGTRTYLVLRRGQQSVVYEGKTYVRSATPAPNGMARFVE